MPYFPLESIQFIKSNPIDICHEFRLDWCLNILSMAVCVFFPPKFDEPLYNAHNKINHRLFTFIQTVGTKGVLAFFHPSELVFRAEKTVQSGKKKEKASTCR